MIQQEIFEIWAPPSAIWSPWAKPVLFSQMNRLDHLTPRVPLPADTTIDVTWAIGNKISSAVVINQPGAVGVVMGLALAAVGYRPVPLYNACPEQPGDTPLVDVRPILHALADNTDAIAAHNLPDDAPPVFLLDAARNAPAVSPAPGLFDNRSISLPTDFPSANLLLSRRITRIVLIHSLGDQPQADLSHTLVRWQEAGLPILAKAAAEPGPPQPIIVHRPNRFRVLWYNLMARAGLILNPLGGYGGKLPMGSSSAG